MTRLNVNPTRQELRRLKGQLKTSVRGHKLLKDKSDEMIRRFCILIRENKRLREEVEEDLRRALSNFASAKAVMDERALEEAFLMPSASVALSCGETSIMRCRFRPFPCSRILVLRLVRTLMRAFRPKWIILFPHSLRCCRNW